MTRYYLKLSLLMLAALSALACLQLVTLLYSLPAVTLAAEPDPDDSLSNIELVEREFMRHNLNPKLGKALLLAESTDRPDIVSSKGAIGLLQVMPVHVKFCGLKSKAELKNRMKNIACGSRLFAYEMKNYKSNPLLAIQAYNGGRKCIGRCAESLNHLNKVMTILANDIA